MKNITKLIVVALYMIPINLPLSAVSVVDGDKKRTEQNFEEMRRKKQEYFDWYFKQYGEYHPNDPRSRNAKNSSHCSYDCKMNFTNDHENDNPYKR
ncbi:MAG: hypothetical protein NTZ68_00655 [Candidatus Dependentiae bacterium]|nr:hypothetical protein [Candidatus Dependentiae bacterium]